MVQRWRGDGGSAWTARGWFLGLAAAPVLLLGLGFLVGPWVGQFRSAGAAVGGEVYGTAFWDGFGSTLVAGIVSALVAVLTVALTMRQTRRQASVEASRSAAEGLSRALAILWSELDVDPLPVSQSRAAWRRFHVEVLVHRPVILDRRLLVQLHDTTEAVSHMNRVNKEAAALVEASMTTDPDTGVVSRLSFSRALDAAWDATKAQMEQLDLDLIAHRRGRPITTVDRPSPELVDLVADAPTAAGGQG